VNNVIKDDVGDPSGSKMIINKSVEGQAQPYNAGFWKYYNVPLETAANSKILEELEGTEFKKEK
jgi:hypothetical protein